MDQARGHSPLSRRVWPPRHAVLPLLVLAALACRREPKPGANTVAVPAGAPGEAPAEARVFTMADLAAATRLDARVQRLLALASEYKTALTFDRGPRLTEHTDVVARRLAEAVRAADESLRDVRDPRDRAVAEPVVAAVRRWPALLDAARTELIASPQPARRAADDLAATDDEVARALNRYRTFRASWRIVNSPAEPEAVLEYLRARRAMEEEEAALGGKVQGGASTAETGTETADKARLRAAVVGVVSTARAAAGKIDEPRKASARRFVDAQARALDALVELAAGGALEEEHGRRTLEYQMAKVDALEAAAEYVQLTHSGQSRDR
jgi:hypothetical protein